MTGFCAKFWEIEGRGTCKGLGYVVHWVYYGKKEGDMMGTMTSRERKSYVRFLLMALRDVRNESNPEKMKSKLDKIIDNLQRTLED